jgi:hypothetical protein
MILIRKINEFKLASNYKPFCIMSYHGANKLLRCLSTLLLQQLNLSNCYQITDQGLQYLSTLPL